MENTSWIIWSIEHSMWWCGGHRGYTEIREEAGQYTYEEALTIVERANIGLQDVPNEAMIQYQDMSEVLKESEEITESDEYGTV